MHCHNAAHELQGRQLVFIPQNSGNSSSTTTRVSVRSGSERTGPRLCAQTRPPLDAWTHKDGVIVISSDDDCDHSEEEEEEILRRLHRVGTGRGHRPDAQARTDVNVLASATVGSSMVGSATPHIDLTDPCWRPPSLEIHRRLHSTVCTAKDSTERDNANGTELVTVKLSLDNSQIKEEITDQNLIKQDLNPEPKSSRGPPGSALQPCVSLKRLSLPDCPQMSLRPAQTDCCKEEPESLSNFWRTVGSDGPHTAPSLVDNPREVIQSRVKQEQQRDGDEFTCTEMQNDSYSGDLLHCSTPIGSPWTGTESKDMHDECWTDTYDVDLEDVDEISCLWDEGNNTEESRLESFRAASAEERLYICPTTLRNILSGRNRALVKENNEGFPQELCHQSLITVYSAIESKCTESALECLSELLQPGVYPPKDITNHLLRGILLNPECAHHLRVKAFHLLLKAQRHHMADRSTVTWDWDLLVSVMNNQDHPRQQESEIVYMLLEYVAQTLEDDFHAKRCTSEVHYSIARAMLSCDRHFSNVRDLIKWLFCAITESNEHGEGNKAASQRDTQIRIVSILQRMLSLAVEVDHTPALTSAKLSQELFHMLIGSTPQRAHRMLLLESMQSKLLQCKLLEQLLDYMCPLKTSLPMSLSLLLHFMKNCILKPDPADGTERWHKWEELIHILWMLLLSYNRAMRGYLNPVTQRGNVGAFVFKQDDRITRTAVCEAVDALLSRSRADLGQALPPNVEESLTYLQDQLLDTCQC